VEVRILGPVEVLVDGAPVRLGGPTQRALLALLAADAGELVPRDRLCDALWPGADAHTAARNVKSYVFSLRKALGAAGTLVQTRPGGYVLELAPEQVDALRFERLVRDGRRALAADPARAAELLRTALALWRGDVLADLAVDEHVAALAGRLAARRLDAIEDRIDADLALGRHVELVPELQSLTAAERLRERPLRQLMLALYRSGRQADALEAFARARAAFVELGLEPGRAAAELQTAILRQDPSLDVAPVESRLRLSLPAPATPLVGRRAELDAIRVLFTEEGGRLVTLTGPGGVGKSRLALEAASELADGFDDGAAFVPLAPLGDAELVQAAIADALGVEPDELVAELSSRRLLLLVDNFEHVDEAAPVVSDLLAAAPGLSCLATSRTALRLYGEFEFRVTPLKLDEAVPLFVARARAAGTSLAPDVVEALCLRLDCLPLAIELVAARAGDLTEADLAALVDPLDVATGGPRDRTPRQQTLRAAIDWSYALLPVEEQALFRRLSVFAGGCTIDAADAVFTSTQSGLTSLVADSLLVRTDERYGMLETIRDYARERLDQSGELEHVAAQHAAYFLTLAEAAAAELRDGAEPAPWLDRLAAEHDNFRAALRWAHESGDPAQELRLAAALRLFWELRGHLAEGRAALDAALARPGDQPADARVAALNAAAVMSYRQGDLGRTRALLDETLALYRKLGDDAGVTRTLNELGNVASESGEHGRAVELYEEAAEQLRSAGDELRLATVLANIGDVYFKDAEYEHAARLLGEAIELQRRVNDRDGMSTSLFTLGRVVFCEGDVERAARLIDDSLAIAVEVGYPEQIGYSLAGMAHVAFASGRLERAARLFAAADATFERIGAAMQQVERDALDVAVSDLERAVGAEVLAAAQAAGRALALDEAVAEARATAVVEAAPDGR
jgi:predicted ATPase/DNA-binding SARP family transcriptional activator